ncbi:gastrula zinc finger protein XlCGF26.1 isoform X20 [Tribolium castaneum]|uniref:gastrula zinc finger protein XlCGF26.1 isoform X20 n=1 Tax=Tribolium castaneum TaxID=7070 RepID=UPI0030FF3838
MGSIENISELCRLCLVKDQVNVPIFEENATKEQTFVKINSCLPVKVSRDDSLPKKICDGCSCKLDMLYTFRNTSVDSEKQLLKWLNQAGLSCSQSAVKDPLASTKPEVTIKQETFEPTDSRDDLGLDTHSYIMQQQKLPYSQEFEFGEPSESNVGLMTDEPAPKKAKRAAALNKASVETDEDDLDAAMQITKAEDEDSDEIDQPEYVEAPSTSADDQPGPSGVNKTTVEAPYTAGVVIKEEFQKSSYYCRLCNLYFSSLQLLNNHRKQLHVRSFSCEYCSESFSNKIPLLFHSKIHAQNNKYPCSECEEQFDAYFALTYHKKIHKKIICELCGEVFVGDCKKRFDNHYYSEHRSEKVACGICKKLVAWNYIDQHKKTQHCNKNEKPPKVKCEKCEKIFSSKRAVQAHKKIRHDRLYLLCEICGKVLMTSVGLKIHLMVHAGEKPIVCDCSGKRFVSNELLRVHQRVHTREKPCICKFCGRKYTQQSSLTIHVKVAHSKDRPFGCTICPRRFVAKSLLNSHLKKQHKMLV